MSYISDMHTQIRIVEPTYGKDADGFPTVSERTVAQIPCRMEVKNATEKWTLRSDLKEANAILTFRCIRGVTITRFMTVYIGDEMYDIVNVEDVRGRGMYTQLIVKLHEEAANSGKAGVFVPGAV